MNEETLNALLEDERAKNAVPDEEKLVKNLKSNVGKQIYKRIIVFVLLVGVFIAGGSLLLDLIFYNPETYTMASESEGHVISDFTILFDNYLGLYYPGTRSINMDTKHHKGFGAYEYHFNIIQKSRKLRIGNYNTNMRIKRGKLLPEFFENDTMMLLADAFYDAGGDQEYYFPVKDSLKVNEDLLSEIRKLPDSAELLCDISYDEMKTGEEFAEFMKTYKCEYYWAAVSNPYAYWMGTVTGINLFPTVLYDTTEEFQREYPGISSSDYDLDYMNSTKEELSKKLTDHYLSSVKLLLDNKRFVSVINSCMGNIKEEQLEQQYNLVKEKGLPIIGCQIRVSKEELLKMIDEDTFACLEVEDVSLSWLAR